jgi:molybdate transport system permease protein
MNDLLPALSLSMRIATVATILAALVGVPLAYSLARRTFPGKSLVEGLILMPMVLPPTVVGYAILMTLGARGWLAPLLNGYSIIFKFEGAVLAAAIVALPMLYLPAKAGFASVESELEDIARLMGANRLQLFWHVSVPLARRGLMSGLVLAFARALGEFGATVMVFGWQPARLTLPISIYADYEQNTLPHAAAAVVALSAMSLGLVMFYNATSRDGETRARKRSG